MVMERLKKVVSEFLAEAREGRLTHEVTMFRSSSEAHKARDTRAKATTIWPVAEDGEVRLARRASDEIGGQLAAAEAHWRTLAPLPGVTSGNPALPAAQQLVQDCEAALKEARAWCTAAENATREWIYTRRRAELRALDTSLRAAVEPAYALAVERQQYTEETTRLAELRDPGDRGHPFPALLGLGAALERPGTWWWDPPTPPVPPPPRGRPGEVRVRFTGQVFDHHNGAVQEVGALGYLPKPVAENLIGRKLAERVGA